MTSRVLVGAMCSGMLLACGGGEQARVARTPAVDGVAYEKAIDNGRQLNGRQLNGRQLNGRQLNGSDLNGKQLNGKQLNGKQLNGKQLNGRQLNGKQLNGRQLNGVEFRGVELEELASIELVGSELVATVRGVELQGEDAVGAEFAFKGEGDAVARMRIADVSTFEPGSDVFRYEIEYREQDAWEPLCGTDEDGNVIAAVPLSGRWNTGIGSKGGDHDEDGSITFACEGFALSKCVELGYEPWVPGGRSLHQACTRMLRADYCGDGRAHTVDGTWINVYDGFGIQADTEDWTFEAEWDADGARCLSSPRMQQMAKKLQCERQLSDEESCGDRQHFENGTLLMTEYEPD